MTLYVRSRRLPLAAATSAAAVALLWLIWSAMSREDEVHPALAVLTVLVALAPLVPTLGGDDDALESTAARPWPPLRITHLIACASFAGALLALWLGPTGELARNVAGMTGMIGLGTALLGTRLAWQLPACWTAAQMFGGPAEGNPAKQLMFWMMQPLESRVAATVAGTLFAAGLIAYALRVGPRRAAGDLSGQ